MKLLAAVIVVATAMRAHAARWMWNAPASCPGEHALEQAVTERLDRPLAHLPFDVAVEVTDEAGQLTAQLVVHGAIEDARVLTSASCRELTDAVAVVIARLAASLPVDEPRVQTVAPIASTRESAPPWNGGVRLGGVVGTGSAPGLGIAAEVGGWVARGSLAVALSGSWWKSTAVILDGTMSGVDVALQSVALRAGWRPQHRIVRAWVVGELGSIRGSAVGLANDRAGAARWSAIGAGGGLAIGLTRQVAALASAEAEYVLDRTQFRVDSGAAVYSTPRFALHGSLAFEVGWR